MKVKHLQEFSQVDLLFAMTTPWITMTWLIDRYTHSIVNSCVNCQADGSFPGCD